MAFVRRDCAICEHSNSRSSGMLLMASAGCSRLGKEGLGVCIKVSSSLLMGKVIALLWQWRNSTRMACRYGCLILSWSLFWFKVNMMHEKVLNVGLCHSQDLCLSLLRVWDKFDLIWFPFHTVVWEQMWNHFQCLLLIFLNYPMLDNIFGLLIHNINNRKSIPNKSHLKSRNFCFMSKQFLNCNQLSSFWIWFPKKKCRFIRTREEITLISIFSFVQ